MVWNRETKVGEVENIEMDYGILKNISERHDFLFGCASSYKILSITSHVSNRSV